MLALSADGPGAPTNVAGRRGRRRPGGREHLQNRHVAAERVLARDAHFAEHVDVLASILGNLDAHLRRDEIAAVDQLLLDQRLDRAQRQPGSLDPADIRVIERPVTVDGEDARQIRFAQDADAQDVLKADDVVGLQLRRPRGVRRRGWR
jgi:hypothetical protein